MTEGGGAGQLPLRVRSISQGAKSSLPLFPDSMTKKGRIIPFCLIDGKGGNGSPFSAWEHRGKATGPMDGKKCLKKKGANSEFWRKRGEKKKKKKGGAKFP